MPEVLFACEQNAGRFTMAAVAAMAAMATNVPSGGSSHVRSARSTQAQDLNRLVVAARGGPGLDLREAFPTPLADDVVRATDAVITTGCGDA